MSIADEVARRGVVEVVHFTRPAGLLGMLHTRAALSRMRLHGEQRLQYIRENNAQRRLDHAWIDYVNLSVSEVNASFFEVSQRWHPEAQWVIAAFEPAILEHPGVYFTTTNNIFPCCARRTGYEGFLAMFADRVRGRFNDVHTRRPGMPESVTTDEQAEVLYPQKLSTDFLRTVYVADERMEDDVHGFLNGVGHASIVVKCDPSRFLRSPWRL